MIYNDSVKHVVQAIEQHKEGGTLSTRGAAVPTSGFFVGGVVDPTVVKGDHDREHLAYLIHSKIVETQSEWVGYWLDPETDCYHIDGVTHTDDLVQAIEWTKNRGEMAFYVIHAGTSLYV